MKRVILILILFSMVTLGQSLTEVLMDSSNVTPSTTYVRADIDGYPNGSVYISLDDSTTVTAWVSQKTTPTFGIQDVDTTSNEYFAQSLKIFGDADGIVDTKSAYHYTDIYAKWLVFKVIKTASGTGASTNEQFIELRKSRK